MQELLIKTIRPFSESECPVQQEASPLLADVLKQRHERAIDVLDAIKHFQQKKQLAIDSIHGFPGTFPGIRRQKINEIDTLNRCINRMYERYNKLNK